MSVVASICGSRSERRVLAGGAANGYEIVFTVGKIVKRLRRFELILYLAFVTAVLLFLRVEMWAQSSAEEAGVLHANSYSSTLNVAEGRGVPEDLVAYMSFGESQKATLQFYLNYRDYPSLATAFLYFSQHESDLYSTVSLATSAEAVYGRTLISSPPSNGLHSLPNLAGGAAVEQEAATGLAFSRSGSVIRSDILVLASVDRGLRSRDNLAFFASFALSGTRLPAHFSAKQGLRLLRVEALSDEAEKFLKLQVEELGAERENYMQSLDVAWQTQIEATWPQLAAVLGQSSDWKRDAFGYYSRYVRKGSSDLPRRGEDLNITLERKAFEGGQGQSRSVIINFGKDSLPMPFAYFIAEAPKGSVVEILCPPSVLRSNLSALPAEYGNTRYQWLLDGYGSNRWIYLSFALEI